MIYHYNNLSKAIMKKIFVFCLAIICVLISEFCYAQTQVTFYTNKGTFVVELNDTLTPITSGNFKSLVNSKFYDGVIFHRVIDNFMIQGGDPTGTGSGGPGYTIADEFDSSLSNVQKTISMANSGPNTGGSQFFINLVNNTYLNFAHAVFGKVILNFSVVQDIGNVPTDNNDRPISNVIMDSLRVTYPFPTGIDEQDHHFFKINIFPNPITKESVISFRVLFENIFNISIYNQIGSVIYSKQKRFSGGLNYISFDEIQKLYSSPGIYHIVITDGVSISQKKFIFSR